MIYFWLVPGKEKEITNGVRVNSDKDSGRHYVSEYENIASPLLKAPAIPADFIESVSCKETVYRGFRKEGLYTEGDAELLITTDQRVHTPMMSDTIVREVWQHIAASAPTLESLKKLYKGVRSGHIKPAEDWQDGALEEDDILSDSLIG